LAVIGSRPFAIYSYLVNGGLPDGERNVQPISQTSREQSEYPNDWPVFGPTDVEIANDKNDHRGSDGGRDPINRRAAYTPLRSRAMVTRW
jgi:hypothetical protein